MSAATPRPTDFPTDPARPDAPGRGPEVIAEPLGGSALAGLALENVSTPWFERRPATPDEWRTHAELVRRSASPSWHSALAGAFEASGPAQQRLDGVAAAGGIVVTTGQQPGLFGGALYTWNKAMAVLALADAIEHVTGIPTAPVFWAATDDADFAEASFTWLRTATGAQRVVQEQAPSDGEPLAEVELQGIEQAFRVLADASGSAADLAPLQAVRDTYQVGRTMGAAYRDLLRRLLQPMGIAVLDASHPALLEAERPLLVRALQAGPAIAAALDERDRALRDAGFEPQVALMRELSLVFGRVVRRKTRVPLVKAADIARAAAGVLSPTVLLRPVVERALLPTVAYVAGPGELAYFAQTGAVADALELPAPLAVPRWSCTVLEPDVRAIVNRLGVTWQALADRHQVERGVARGAAPPSLVEELDAVRERVRADVERVKAIASRPPTLLDPRVLDGATRGMLLRLDRVERRLLAAVKRREAATMRDIAVAAGAVFPGGKRQERALNFIPLLARYGAPLVDTMRASARRHADALIAGQPLPVRG